MNSVIKLDEEYKGYAPNLFSLPNHYERCVSSVLIPYGFIKDRVEKLAEEISEIYAKEEFLVCVCVLKGAFRFYCDLVQHLKNAIRHADRPTILDFEFIQLSSYRNDENTGTVNFLSAKSIFKNFAGKNVLIIEDIVESGATMLQLIDALDEYKCKSIKSVSLLIKSKKSTSAYKPDFVGFDVPDRFVIGYGLDYNEVFRDMDHICEISKEGLDKYRVKEAN